MTGEDYATLEEAIAAYEGLVPFGNPWYVELNGPGLYEHRFLRENDDTGDDRVWEQEHQMQLAMGHGCDGWNLYAGELTDGP